ncbi:hypothetical protein E5S69_04800 [Cupriavidus necator]|uniref:hypothetical protein n=1 Tax=Cupriavidus necator TaxID=106590 RepID=UPI00148FD029|nr:hypothetical protein [Cupriavidus necator]NOV22855.1 hypothetical protein [Cupriavidus necator]
MIRRLTRMVAATAALAPCPASAQIVPTLEELLTAQNRWRADAGLSYFNHKATGTAARGPIYIQVGQNVIPVATGVVPKTRNVDSLVAYAGLRYGHSANTELSFSGTGSYTNERTLLEGFNHQSSNSTNFSSLSLAISHRFLKERGSPGLVAYLETGAVEHSHDATSYFSSFTAGGTLYRTIDPVVLSLNASYRLNLPRHDKAGRPGNVLMLTPQVGFAANETVTLYGGINWQLQQAEDSSRSLPSQRNTQTALVFGLGYRASDRTTISLSANANISGYGGAQVTLGTVVKLGAMPERERLQ